MYNCMEYNYCTEAHGRRKGFFFCPSAREKRNINPYYAWIPRHMDELCNESEIIWAINGTFWAVAWSFLFIDSCINLPGTASITFVCA